MLIKANCTIKKYEELEYTDNFMFGHVMQDGKLCHDVLECLLQRPVGELEDVVSEREFRYTSDGKPIRMDIYTRDDREIYDAEAQNLNNKSIESLELPKRTRFYQAALDTDFLNKGYPYKALPESTIIFICTFDPFGKGLARYTFREKCEEDTNISMNDAATKVFFNCKYKGIDIPEDLREFYEYVENGKCENSLTRRIDEAVINARKMEKWRSEYMKEMALIMDYKEEGREEGREEGSFKRLIGLICKKLAKGKSVTTIAEDLEEDDETLISKICTIAEKYAPDYDIDAIYEEYAEMQSEGI